MVEFRPPNGGMDCKSTRKYECRSNALHSFLVDAESTSRHGEFAEYGKCLVSARAPVDWSGCYADVVPNANANSDCWAMHTPLQKLDSLKAKVLEDLSADRWEESRAIGADAIRIDLERFGSNRGWTMLS